MKLNLLKSRVPSGVMFLLLSFVPNNLFRLTPVAAAQAASSHCVPVSGALMTNIGAIAGVTNLGPASGDLAGSLAATILGQNGNGTYNVQHYWVTAAGETITLKKAVLTPTYRQTIRASLLCHGGITGHTSRVERANSKAQPGIWTISGWRTFIRTRWCCAIEVKSATSTRLRMRLPS